MKLKNKTVGIALTGSFCTYEKIFNELEKIKAAGAEIVPIMSEASIATDTRFGSGKDFAKRLEEMSGSKVLSNIESVEPIGPNAFLDILVIVPCTEGEHKTKNLAVYNIGILNPSANICRGV